MDGNLTLYYWNIEDYNAATVLTTENATGAIIAGSDYRSEISGIAAKQIDETLFVVAVYQSEGGSYSSSVISYSLGYYCSDRAANGSAAMQPLAKATAVYGNYAKAYFANT